VVDGVEVGGSAVTSRLHDVLADGVGRVVRQAGVVVWQDEHAEYATVVRSVCPPDVRLVVFDGSWYELRRSVEALLAGDTPPMLLVYAPVAAPADDPLAEIRSSGREFKRRLATLVRKALDGELAAARIEQIANEARTFEEAEAAASGAASAGVRLVSIFGTSDVPAMAFAVLAGTKDQALDAEVAWDEVASTLRDAYGGALSGAAGELRDALARHLLLADLDAAAGVLPDELGEVFVAPTVEQRRRVGELLQRWRYLPEHSASYQDMATAVDAELALADVMRWVEGLETCVALPSIEQVCLAEATRRLGAGDALGALVIAEARLLDANLWRDQAAGAGGGRWGDRWRVIAAIAGLHRALDANPAPSGAADVLLDWYVNSGWEVDRGHRRLELARLALPAYGDLEEEIIGVRSRYEAWLDAVLRMVSDALATNGLDGVGLGAQGSVHDDKVRGRNVLTAYVWVDALRYELGIELADAIRHDITDQVTVSAATAAAPTITRVGMANLTPTAAETLTVSLEGGKLAVTVGERPVASVEQRVELLRAAHGTVANLELGDVSQQGEKELAKAIKGADLVLVRSQEIDAAGESGMLNAAWPQFDAIKQDLANAVAKLGQVGVGRVVICADHGFVALSQSVGNANTIDAPIGGAGELHRRCWVGKGGTTAEGTVRVPLSLLGVRSDLDVIVPRGLAVFKAGGGKQFFHGGLSPQELIVPVIEVDLEPATEPQKLDLAVTVAGGRITTGVFAATVEFHGDLFTSKVTLRVVVRGADGSDPVARVVSGDGYDAGSGSVTVQADRVCVLTFQVTRNLVRDSQVELQVLDARTGRRLAEAVAEVAAPVVVEEDL
jgi:hypothetical protein